MKKGDKAAGSVGSRGSGSGRARVCPTSSDHADGDGGGGGGGDGAIGSEEVDWPTTTLLSDGSKPGGLDCDGGAGAGAEKRPGTGGSDERPAEEEREDDLAGGNVSSSESEEEDSLCSVDSDQASDGEFCVDLDVVDDVTNDEGFELGEVRSPFAASTGRKSSSGRDM